jgi:TRAP-type mannitol/chloroaromatic compound transport system substrate-binding protein
VPPFEILDATHKKVIDGGHGISYYWVGKNKAATLFSNTPAGIAGMDHIDFLGWIYEGGGLDMWWEFYQKELKLNVIAFPVLPSSPQAFGWFKRPIKNLADFKGMKCRQTGIVAEIFQKMGMQTVNLPGGEIIPSAQRGVIDCAEWVGGIEDLRLGLPQVWKYHYTPGMHESASIGEIIINSEVWASLTPQQQEAVRSSATETFMRWSARWQKQNAEAIEEMRTKYGTQILRTPPDVLLAFLKAWDEIAKEESAKNPFFKKVIDSQRAYAAKVVPAKRFMFPPYSFTANYYYPEKKSAAKGEKK